MMSPTARTQQYLRKLAYIVGNVEKWNPYARIRQDLFGCFDTIAVDWPNRRVLFIQSTSHSNHNKRVAKVRGSKVFESLSDIPSVEIEVWSWGKQGKRGKRKLWTLRRESLTPRHTLD